MVWLQAFFQASAQMPTRGIYSDLTLPYVINMTKWTQISIESQARLTEKKKEMTISSTVL
jgi:hypothetical protein